MVLRFFKYYFVGFFLIFGPVLNGTPLGPYGDVIFLLSLVIIFFGALTSKKIGSFSKEQVFFTAVSLLLIIYPMVTSLLFDPGHFKDNIQVYLKPVRILITYLGCYYFVRNIYNDRRNRPESKVKYVFNIIYYSVVLHAIIMCIQFLSPTFRDAIYKYTMDPDNIRGAFILNFRMGGLVGIGGATLSVFQSIGFLIFPFIQKQTKIKWVKVLNIIFQVLIFLSMIICGRSGIVAVFLFFPIVEMLRGKAVLAVLVKYMALYIAMFFIGYALLMIALEFIGDDSLGGPLFRSFDILIQSKEAGSYQNETQDIWTSMLLFPNDIVTIVFGNPFYFTNASSLDRVLDSDIGYIIYWWAFGIIGFFLYHATYLYLLIKGFIKRKVNSYFVACLLVTIITLFFQTKEMFIFARVGFSMHMLLFFAAIFQDKHKMNPIKTVEDRL